MQNVQGFNYQKRISAAMEATQEQSLPQEKMGVKPDMDVIPSKRRVVCALSSPVHGSYLLRLCEALKDQEDCEIMVDGNYLRILA